MNWKIGKYLFTWILLTCTSRFTLSSHFGGASASWRTGVVNELDGTTEILIDFRVAWRADDSVYTTCNQEDVYAGKELDPYYDWTCTEGCSGIVATSAVNCTEFDVADNWSVGFRTVSYSVEGSGPFKMVFADCCWIDTLVYGGDPWSLPIEVNLGIRSDTAEQNNSPVSAVTPVIRFKAGCPDHIDIVMYDADDDLVSCRFPSAAECINNMCTTYPYFKLTEQDHKCRLTYNGGGPGNTDVAIVLILEDFPQDSEILMGDSLYSNSTHLSSVSMQFVIRLFNILDACHLKPKWVSPTFPNGRVATVLAGQAFHTVVKVQSETLVESIKVVGPLAVVKSNMLVDADTYEIDLNWIPTIQQKGPNVICVTAKDISSKMSEQRCIIVLVGVGTTPCSVDNGGCSDICAALGTASYLCECSRPCWQLAPDKRTCLPSMSVDCQEYGFYIELASCAVGGSSATVGIRNEASDDGSTSICHATNDGHNFIANFSYYECGTQTDDDFLEIHFRNQMRVWLDDVPIIAGSGSNNITITRGFWYNINTVCSFNRYGNVNASFVPRDQEEGQVLVPGLGSFQFFFDFYMNQDFQYTYSPYEYPITVTVNSDIYFGIRASGGTGLEVFTEKCVAMTTPTPTVNTVSYTMIENGCSLDNTLRKHDATSEMEERYSIKAFRFQEELIADSSLNIYIQCSAVLCVLGQPSTRCQKGCITTRKRRSADDEIYLDHQIRTRKKRATNEAETSTFAPNVSESTVLQITVSGPFRIEVFQPTNGNPLVTVVTPTTRERTPEPPQQTKKPQQPTTVIIEADPFVASGDLILVIASSVGGFLMLLLIIILISFFAYHYLIIAPKRKINPNSSQREQTEAWTHNNQTFPNDTYDYEQMYDNRSSKTPPPSFWDIEPLT